MTLRLADFDAVTFDVYGTLIDWEPSIIAFLTRWAQKHGVSAPGPDLLMAFDRDEAVGPRLMMAAAPSRIDCGRVILRAAARARRRRGSHAGHRGNVRTEHLLQG
jgi:FMN phosphatase YigB (HAD superfamily)